MPRSLAIFKAKKKWRIEYEPPSNVGASFAPNYASAREQAAKPSQKVEEDLALGRVQKWIDGEAKKK